MKLDWETGNFIGKGETATIEIVKQIYGLKELNKVQDWHKGTAGIFTQVPLIWLLKPDFLQNLAGWHQKGSIDVLMRSDKFKKIDVYWTHPRTGKKELQGKCINGIVCLRVQGWSHFSSGPKPLRDLKQLEMLQKSGNLVVDLPVTDCKVLFDDLVNEKSISEVKFYLRKERILGAF
jgi:hypothetical protein